MRRLARHLFTLGSAVSLILCVAVCVLWVRSYFVSDALAGGWVNDPPTSGAYVQAHSNCGAISLRRFDVAVVGDAPPTYRVDDGLQINVGRRGRWTTSEPHKWVLARHRYLLGFSRHDATYLRRPAPDVRQTERDRGVTFPHWVPMLAAAVLPAWWWLRSRRARRRLGAGLCAPCGYDLRASPGRCPECGIAWAAQVTT